MKEKYNKEKMDLTLEETMLAFRLNAMCFGQSESKINEQHVNQIELMKNMENLTPSLDERIEMYKYYDCQKKENSLWNRIKRWLKGE